MRIEIDADKTGRMTLEGDLTIQSIGELRTGLLEAMEAVDALVIDMGMVTGIDMACLQLFCSAHRTYVREGKTLSFRYRLADDIRRVVETAGYSANACGADVAEKTCLWNGGRD